MGAECPNRHGMQNVVVNITADGTTPKHPHEVIAVRLKCGCVVGGEEYTRFQEAVMKIAEQEAEELNRARKNAADKKASAYNAYVLKGGQINAE